MLPLEERPAWLAALPSQYELLREPLRRLLEVQSGIQTRPFLDAFTSGLEGLTPPATVIVGDVVGPYRLLQQLGDGGMGSVWLAERADGTLKRRVALKLPRMVWARDLSARMARERDILGSLEHSNIARLYDAGVDQLGRPFLALEYVEGQRIDQYCDEQLLSVSARIRLYLQVLDAVHYAHVNLVLHRDLKPGNVLVNQRGEVRLLDFGIAKLMSDEESPVPIDQNSRTLARAMTPRYASPEQVQHLRLTLASDVYSLGVMLYELLIGASPLITQKGSRAEIETAILEGDLRTPSRAKVLDAVASRRATTPTRLSRTLRGDLDAVLLKAMSRNLSERYPSVEAFRADLIRWLEERPVLAKPPSRIAAVRKFIARNAVTVTFGSAAACTVVAAAVIATLQAHEARIESRRATATRDFLIGLFDNANPELHGGREISAREMLSGAEKMLDESRQFGVETKSELYATTGRLWASIGDFDRAKSATEKRLETLNKLGQTRLKAAALDDFAEVSVQLKSISDLSFAITELDRLYREIHPTTRQKSDLSWYTGWRDLNLKNCNDALHGFTSALIQAREAKDSERVLRSIYGTMMTHALCGNREGAQESYRNAISILPAISINTADRLRRELELASALYHIGEYTLGWPLISRLSAQSKTLYGDFSPSQQAIHHLWALWRIRMGRSREVQSWLRARQQYLEDKNSHKELGARLDIRFGLLKIEALLESNDPYTAANELSMVSAYKTKLPFDVQLQLSIFRLVTCLALDDLDEFRRELTNPIWLKAKSVASGQEWEAYRLWYQGIDLFLEGRYAKSREVLSGARLEAARNFGESHPRTLMISFNETLVWVFEDPDSDQTSKRIIELEGIVNDLSLRLPADGRVMKTGRRVIGDLTSYHRQGIKLSRISENSRRKMLLH